MNRPTQIDEQRLHASKHMEDYTGAAAEAVVADIHVAVVNEGRFPSLPSPAARSDSSMVYAGFLRARQRFLCTLLFQCERSAASVS